ncbi:unnamed protein product [Tenebrio molitor]|nr:unnamed protein product [Tenebrio molitor]
MFVNFKTESHQLFHFPLSVLENLFKIPKPLHFLTNKLLNLTLIYHLEI